MIAIRCGVVVGCLAVLLGPGLGAGVGQLEKPAEPVKKDSAWAVYRHGLNQKCGGKRLELLSPGELLDQVEGFKGSLTPVQQGDVEKAMDESCSGVTMGASCNNTGFLQAAISMGKMDGFVARVCALPERCTRQSVCEKTDK